MASMGGDILALDLAHAALAAAIACRIKAHIPGDAAEEHEDNTFDLPDGSPLRRRLRAFFREQLKQVVGTIPTLGHPLDAPPPRMGLWDQPMADAFTPILGVYYDKAGRSVRGRIGLDPDAWRVTDPHIHRAIEEQAFTFCRATNRTTDLGIAEARDAVRDQIARGLLDRGQAIPQLTARVRSVFTHASKSRAERIARTEAARAIHAASEMSAKATGLVKRKVWLLSAHSCPYCKAIAAEHPEGVELDAEFGQRGSNPDYRVIRYPPLHPNCRCSLLFDLDAEPPDEKPRREPDDEKDRDRDGRSGGEGESGSGGRPGNGSPTPRPTPTIAPVPRTARRVAAFVAVPAVAHGARTTIRSAIRAHRRRAEDRDRRAGRAPVPSPVPIPGLIPPGPIRDRIKAYMEGAGKAKLERLANLDRTYERDLAGVEAARAAALKELDTLRRRKGHAHEDTLAADAKVREFTDRRDAYRDSLRRNAVRVAEAIAIPAAGRALISTRMVTKGRPLPLAGRQAEGFLTEVLAADPGHPKGLKVEYGALRNVNERANYSDKDRRINLTGAEPATTICHELGHAIEHQWPEVGARSAEFLDDRTAGEKIRRLADIFPKRGFGKYERGRKDHFGRAFDDDASDPWYCGKEYRRDPRRADTRYGTEILSMGVEKLMRDPVKFARQDPEFAAYILGILDGSLR